MEIKRSLTKLVCVPLQGNAWHLPGALRHTDDSTSLFQISSSERLLNTLLAASGGGAACLTHRIRFNCLLNVKMYRDMKKD